MLFGVCPTYTCRFHSISIFSCICVAIFWAYPRACPILFAAFLLIKAQVSYFFKMPIFTERDQEDQAKQSRGPGGKRKKMQIKK